MAVFEIWNCSRYWLQMRTMDIGENVVNLKSSYLARASQVSIEQVSTPINNNYDLMKIMIVTWKTAMTQCSSWTHFSNKSNSNIQVSCKCVLLSVSSSPYIITPSNVSALHQLQVKASPQAVAISQAWTKADLFHSLVPAAFLSSVLIDMASTRRPRPWRWRGLYDITNKFVRLNHSNNVPVSFWLQTSD